MIALAQRDLPYLVLTDDPNLQAYRTDRLGEIEQVCPSGDRGDLICEQVSYTPILTLAPSAGGESDDGGGSTGIIIVVAVLVLGAIAFLVLRRRREGGGRGPVELET
jgi:MYXO-CTERM domain-containing protein